MSNNNQRSTQNGESALSMGMTAPDFADADKRIKASKASDSFGMDGFTKADLELQDLQDSTTSLNSDGLIKDVWLSNFFSCMDHISKLVDTYNYISMVCTANYLSKFYQTSYFDHFNRTLSIPELSMFLQTRAENSNTR
jgi:hypothetical protein